MGAVEQVGVQLLEVDGVSVEGLPLSSINALFGGVRARTATRTATRTHTHSQAVTLTLVKSGSGQRPYTCVLKRVAQSAADESNGTQVEVCVRVCGRGGGGGKRTWLMCDDGYVFLADCWGGAGGRGTGNQTDHEALYRS